MRPLKIKFLTYAAMIAGILLLTACPPDPEDPELSVSPTRLVFEADETGEKSVTIDTDQKSWSYNFDSNWLNADKRSDSPNKLFVSVREHTNANDSRSATITITAGKAAPVEVTIEQRKRESITINPSPLLFAANEQGTKTVSVTTTNGSAWSASSPGESWVTCSKQNNQTLEVTVSSANPLASDRSASITITAGSAEPQTLTVTQTKQDVLSVNPSSLSFTSNDTEGKNVTVTTNVSTWNATPSESWITLSQNNDILTVTVARNTTSSSRTGTIRVTAGSAPEQIITVSQPPDDLSISPTSLSFASNPTSGQNTTITTNVGSWDYTSSASWLTLSKNNNTLTVTASQNTSTSARDAEVIITAGYAPSRTLNVHQDAPPSEPPYLTVSVTSLSFTYSRGTRTFTISSNVDWTVTRATATWLTVSPTPGSNNATITVDADANGCTSRSGTITVTGGGITRTISVTQAASPDCPPITNNYNYSASGTPIFNNPSSYGYNYSSWTGLVVPLSGENPPCIGISNWANSGAPIYLNWVNGSFRIDYQKNVVNDADGVHAGRLFACTYNSSTEVTTVYTDYEYPVSYNATTRVLDFSGTYNGLQVCVGIFPVNKSTGQFVNNSGYYFNIYRNLRITLTSIYSAPQLQSKEALTGFDLLQRPVKIEDMKIEVNTSTNIEVRRNND